MFVVWSLPTFCNYNCPPSFIVLFNSLGLRYPSSPMGGHLTCSDLQCKWLAWDTCLSISSFLGSWLLHDVTFTHTLALCHLVEVRTSLEKKIGSVLNLKIDLSFFCGIEICIHSYTLSIVLQESLRLCSVFGAQEKVGWLLSFCLALETGSFTTNSSNSFSAPSPSAWFTDAYVGFELMLTQVLLPTEPGKSSSVSTCKTLMVI